jgi:hypothetical protein
MALIGETTFTPQGVYPTPPTTLRCGYPYHFVVTVRRGVDSCKGQNFEALYTRANEIAKARIALFTCPSECSPLDAVEVARAWNCEDSVAWASVKYLAICPTKPDTYNQLGRAAGFGKPASDPPKATFDDVNEVFVTALTDPVRMACNAGAPKWFPHQFDYIEYNRDCTEYQRDSKPFEARAKAAADLAAHMALFDCNLPCHLHARTTLLGQQCKDDYARLRIKIEVDCS